MSEYIFSYTAATMMINETHSVAEVYATNQDWNKTKDIILEDNIMQKNAISSRKRVFVELKRRLGALTEKEFEHLLECSSSDAKAIIFLSILKTYRFIYEFMVEVVQRKVLLFDYKILNSDYESFFESKKYAVEQLENITEATTYKLKQVLFRILEEAAIIDSAKNKNIQKPHLSSKVIELILKDDAEYLRAFLYTDYEIETLKKRLLCD